MKKHLKIVVVGGNTINIRDVWAGSWHTDNSAQLLDSSFGLTEVEPRIRLS